MKRILAYGAALAAIVGTLWYAANRPSYDDLAEMQRIDQYLQTKVVKHSKDGYSRAEMPDIYAEIERELRTPSDLSEPSYSDNYLLKEYKSAHAKKKIAKSNSSITFKERGPGNVAGRTRSLIIYKGDPTNNTWLAGSVSGGVWLTKDAGMSWEHKSKGLPNLGSGTMASSSANPNVVYLGTGEHFTRDIDGAGMFKSLDFGETWTQMADPEIYPDFKNVSRIIVDPNDENVVVATTRNSVWSDSLISSIYKTVDGGETWTQMRTSTQERHDDINFDPTDFNTMYVAIRRKGVIKSTDGGQSWTYMTAGMSPSGRVEIDVSPVNPQVIWASAQGTQSGSESDLYISTDGAQTWNLLLEEGTNVDFLGGQGWYDNIITAHPINEDEVYVGGVNLWKFKATTEEFDNVSHNLVENGTEDFLGFVNGNSIGGGIDFFEGINTDDVPSIEVRFGQGTQMAHRFTVNRRGPGVPVTDYAYQDYVEVPFQVWDVENDRQLMVSFRDQQEDGQWTLKRRNVDAPHEDDSREYILIHDMDYNISPSPQIAKAGGHETDQYYIIWPIRIGETAVDYPLSSFTMNRFQNKGRRRITTNVSDAYLEHRQINTFSSENFKNNKGVHPDQHNILTIRSGNSNAFRLLVTNDGGVYMSKNALDPGTRDDAFEYRGFGYNTTQFYSADKAPGRDQYIGGMQDNSTWYTPPGIRDVNAATKYRFAFGGDGFEAIWHNLRPREMLGSIQFNNIQRTINGGTTWANATNGLDDTGQGSAPFRSRLANSKLLPDRVFAVGVSGVWRSEDFAQSWTGVPILDTMWSFRSSMDIEVSIADFDVVWTGGALTEDSRLYVSDDGGLSFARTGYYDKVDMGSASGIATHPLERETAYALFSFQGRPKVLKTTDLGGTWEDISGFEESEDGKSTRGFPDVAVTNLIVFPHDTDHIWVGSEIGIIETTDGGQSWALLETPMGPVNIHDFQQMDDQIVIATYGRGIWTAQSPDFQRNLLYPPLLSNAAVTPSGRLNVDVLFNASFDSTQVLLDDEYLMTIGTNRVGTQKIDLNIADFEERDYTMKVVSHKDEETVESNEVSFFIKVPGNVITEYFNDFEDETQDGDFFGEGLEITEELGISGRAIHSQHPYPDRSEAIIQLSKSVQIMSNSKLYFKEIGIIETGEFGSTFGSEDFYDYAVVEGSSDGVLWEPLAYGYDATKHTEWLNAYNATASGSEDLIKDNLIYLEDMFDVGDTILIRWRLSSDPATNGWGWMIDDVTITQEVISSTIDIEYTDIKVYPNPTSDYLQMELDQSLEYTDAMLLDVHGRVVDRWSIRGVGDKRVDVSTVPSGLYILSLSNERNNTVQRIIIE